jgi:predicted house-cleaning noncanonical NTP pyrophosphatase (MazG superfamily)
MPDDVFVGSPAVVEQLTAGCLRDLTNDEIIAAGSSLSHEQLNELREKLREEISRPAGTQVVTDAAARAANCEKLRRMAEFFANPATWQEVFAQGTIKPCDVGDAATFEDFWRHLSDWSQATFGSDSDRGPVGPLKHLAKEVQECLEDPTDLEEFVDLQFLVFDAARRAGFTLPQLVQALWKKLDKNRQRKWGPPTANEAVEHIRDEE